MERLEMMMLDSWLPSMEEISLDSPHIHSSHDLCSLLPCENSGLIIQNLSLEGRLHTL